MAQKSDEKTFKLDSLTTIIEGEYDDTTIAQAYIELTNLLYVQNMDTIVELSNKALEQIKYLDLNNKKNLIASENITADAYNNLGYYYLVKGMYNEALTPFMKSFGIRKRIKDRKGLSSSLNNLAYLYQMQGDIEKALEFYNQSLQLRKEMGDREGVAQVMNNIGLIYNSQDENDMALEYWMESMKIKQEVNDQHGLSSTYSNIAFIYQKMGNDSLSMVYNTLSLELRKELNDKIGMATSLNNIGHLYEKQGDYLKALEYYKQGLSIRRKENAIAGIAYSLANVGQIEFKLGRKKLAKSRFNEALELALKTGSPKQISHASKQLYKFAKKENQFEQALEMYELHIQMRDSIKNEETQKAAIRQQTKYEFEKAELLKQQKLKEGIRKEKEATDRRNNLQYSIIFIAILGVFGLVLVLGIISVSPKVAEGLIFFAFLIFFEFLLVLSDPYVERFTNGEPMYKLLVNAMLAGAIFPMHAFFEAALKTRLIKKNEK